MSRRSLARPVLVAAVTLFLVWFLWLRDPFTSKEAIVTVVSSGIYLPGAIVLAWTIRKHTRVRNLIALIPQGTMTPRQLEMLSKVGWKTQEVETIPLPTQQPGDPRFEDMLDKLYAFGMVQYKTIGLIDADAYVVANLNEAFDLFSRSSVPLAASLAPITGSHTHTQDHFSGHFNGGFMMLKPDLLTQQSLLALSSNASYYDVSLAEQNLLNQFFEGQWLGLPSRFNLLYRFRDRPGYWAKLRPSAAIVHFAGLEKPWHGCKQDKLLCTGIPPELQAWRNAFTEAFKAVGFRKSDFYGEEEQLHFTIDELVFRVG